MGTPTTADGRFNVHLGLSGDIACGICQHPIFEVWTPQLKGLSIAWEETAFQLEEVKKRICNHLPSTTSCGEQYRSLDSFGQAHSQGKGSPIEKHKLASHLVCGLKGLLARRFLLINR